MPLIGSLNTAGTREREGEFIHFHYMINNNQGATMNLNLEEASVLTDYNNIFCPLAAC